MTELYCVDKTNVGCPSMVSCGEVDALTVKLLVEDTFLILYLKPDPADTAEGIKAVTSTDGFKR